MDELRNTITAHCQIRQILATVHLHDIRQWLSAWWHCSRRFCGLASNIWRLRRAPPLQMASVQLMPPQSIRLMMILDLPAEIVIKQQLAPGEVAVYECVQDGHTTISDRPCGPGAIGRIIDTRQLNTYSQAPVAPVDMKRHRQPPVSGAGPRIATPQTAQSARAARCKSIQDEIDSINARMRQPYRKEEGEWLRRRWHSAKELYYDEDCGKLDLPAP